MKLSFKPQHLKRYREIAGLLVKFGLSEGMVLAAGGADRPHRVATFDSPDVKPGDKIS